MMSGKIDPSALSLIGWVGREGLEEKSYIYGEKVKQAKILLELDLDKSLVVPKGEMELSAMHSAAQCGSKVENQILAIERKNPRSDL